jgi:hypothetical protein
VCCDEKGVISFGCSATGTTSRGRSFTRSTCWLNGADLRREVRKATLNEHMEYREGGVVFQHACKMGLEGIVWKRLGSRYRSGRSPDWLNFKNPDAPAVRREAEEDWGR